MKTTGGTPSIVETPDDRKSDMATCASLNAAVTITAYQGNLVGNGVELPDVFEKVADAAIKIRNGELFRLESMLLGQAMALESMFTSLAHRAHNQERMVHIESFLSLALKAQAQSRATISALVDLKYPRQVAFVKQTNVSNGPQQVNNGVSADSGDVRVRARTEEKQNSTNKLSGANHELLRDARTSSTTIESNPRVATVAKVHRAKVRRG